MKQKVVFAMPSHGGTVETECVFSLLAATHLLTKKGIEVDLQIINGCAYLPVARNTLVSMFMKDPDATDLFFIDSDVGFDAGAVLKLLERPEYIVAGIYPLKRDTGGYPVKVKTIGGVPIGRDGLIEAECLPTGFMRIKRYVFEEMERKYPELRYETSLVNTTGAEVGGMYDFFNMGMLGNSKWTTEDFAFCERWRDIGGQLWVYPSIEFTHTGRKAFTGNYQKYLMGCSIKAEVGK